MRATIVGAGIGGLATNVALRHAGWDVSVWERASAPAERGTALGMWPVANLVMQLSEDDIDRLFDAPTTSSYVSGNAVPVGDAAHAMAPNLGRGACESLVDAICMSRALASTPAVAAGLKTYDRKRRRRTQRTVRAARVLNHVATARRGTSVRDVGLRAHGNALQFTSSRHA